MIQQKILDSIGDVYREFGVEGVLPQAVVIQEDCRADSRAGNTDLTHHLGIKLGDFYMPSLLEINRGETDEFERLHDALFVQPDEYSEESEFRIANPLILADNGELIWGMECYWQPFEQAPEDYALQVSLKLNRSVEDLAEEFESNQVVELLRQRLAGELLGADESDL